MLLKIEVLIGEISLYLDSFETFQVLCLVNKDILAVVNTAAFKVYWLRSFFKIHWEINYKLLEKLFLAHVKNKILRFAPWKTDGGVSRFEHGNSFENMWRYNGTNYSTEYQMNSELPISSNRNCLAWFAGGKQTRNNFCQRFHNDLYTYTLFGPREKYRPELFDQEKCLILDPLGKKRLKNIQELEALQRHNHPLPLPGSFNTDFPVFPSEEVPLITKIALARPFFYTGAVKTLLILLSEDYQDIEFQYFDKFNNISTIEAAESIGKPMKKIENSEISYIEYEKTAGFSPLLWVQFRKFNYNHIEIKLSSPCIGRAACVKLIDIDDRRADYDLASAQPNFDITYALFIGTSISI